MDHKATGPDTDASTAQEPENAAAAAKHPAARPEENGSDADRPHPVRVCVIDLGTNSFHAVIVDAYPNRSFTVVDKIKERVHLGEHGLTQHVLTEDAVQRAIQALKRIRMLAEGWKAEEYLAFATSAIREAENGGQFVQFVREEIGIDVRPISGSLEARLIYEGVRRAVELDRPSLLVDLGGGSTEFIAADANRAWFACSLPLGAARMTERFVSSDPLSDEDLARLRDHYRTELADVYGAVVQHACRTMVGSSGTMENLADACRRLSGDPNRSIYLQSYSADAFRDVTRALIAGSRDERAGMEGIEAKRLDQIVAGAVLVDVLLEDLPIEDVRLSPDALREGMVMHFIENNYKRLERLAPLGDVRRRQVYELAERFDWVEGHARHVTQLAVQLFDACRELHGLGDRERELLEFAGLLHDIGYIINRRKHHKHSRYLIRKADWHGFQPEEIEVIAMVARYHRRALPKKSHKVYGDMDKKTRRVVRRLAAFLRLAEGLDRSHSQNVVDMNVQVDPEQLRITIRTREDPQMELWGARHAADLFEKEFERKVQVSAAWERRGS